MAALCRRYLFVHSGVAILGAKPEAYNFSLGSPTAPSGPKAGGANAPTTTQQGVGGNRGTTGQAKGAGASPTQGSGSPTAPSGPKAGGANPPR